LGIVRQSLSLSHILDGHKKLFLELCAGGGEQIYKTRKTISYWLLFKKN